MTENEFLLADRIAKIQSIIEKYGEDNFYLSFSGGKDSTVLHNLLDLALPGNKIPRVYANTGIELNMVRDFVLELQKNDDRIVVIKPTVPIRETLEEEGYPFKSKVHARFLERYQKYGMMKSVRKYVNNEYQGFNKRCPAILKYQFTPEFKLKISHKCCVRMKEDVCNAPSVANKKPYSILGIMLDEGGARDKAHCLAFNGDKLHAFQPLVVVDKQWEDWFIETYNVKICDIYKPPYNFARTGCKGCPFALELQKELDTLEKYFPNERKQCELIWKPVYAEYRRLGYRLKPHKQMTLDDYIWSEEEDE